MILDQYITYDDKIKYLFCRTIWIYFRTTSCYILLPRSLLSVLLFLFGYIIILYEPLFLPIGLFAMIFTINSKN